MNEELLQRDLLKNPEKIGKWDFYNVGATSVKALKAHGLIRNIDYGKVEPKKVDGLIISHKNVLVVIENKRPATFNSDAKKAKAVHQEISVARALGAKIFVATDTLESIWINVATGNAIRDENGQLIKTVFDKNNEHLPNLIEKILRSINTTNDNIKPVRLVNPTDLASQIWQDIWSVSGATPENCLYTFVELFIFKYLSDLNILGEGFNFDHLMSRYEYNVTEPEEKALEYYAGTIRPEIKSLFPENNIDKTTIINGTIFVSKAQKAVKGYSSVFRKVLGRFRDYGKLENIDVDFKSQLFESFLKESISKKNWGQFFTPLKVVRAIAEMAKDEIKPGIRVCDPACGVGKFLLEPIAESLTDFYSVSKGTLKSNIEIHGFDKGFDKDEQKTIILAKANMLIYFSDLIRDNTSVELTRQFAKLFNESFVLKTNSILGTLSDPIKDYYDLILTNPPYVTSGSSNLKDEIRKDGDLSLYYKINAVGVEGLFMEWIVKALKPGGKAFIIVPDSIFTRVYDKSLRDYIVEHCIIDAIISLPNNTFFTTSKKTFILAVTKKTDISVPQSEPIFTYLVSEIGETRDINRFDIEQNDLAEAATLFSFFKGNKSKFSQINSDLRCKIVEFDAFLELARIDWNIDKWWSDEEKVTIGILDKKDVVDLLSFSSVMLNTVNTITELQKELQDLASETIDVNEDIFIQTPLNEILHFPSIKGLTKSFINDHQGKIPVYGGKIFEEPIGYVEDNLETVKYFSDCLAWNREGSVGYVFWHKHKFTTNDHHRPMIIKDEYTEVLDKDYLRIKIQEVLMKQGFAWSKTASKEKVEKLSVALPVSSDGQYDLLVQKTISAKIMRVEEIKKQLSDELNIINDLKIDL